MTHAGAAPGANTDIFTALTPTAQAAVWRIQIALTTGSKVDVRVTDGSTAYSQTLNNDTALTAACLYTFTFMVAATSSLTGTTALTYSIRVKTDSVIQTLIVDEIIGGVI
jgi:hypothetical protein